MCSAKAFTSIGFLRGADPDAARTRGQVPGDEERVAARQ